MFDLFLIHLISVDFALLKKLPPLAKNASLHPFIFEQEVRRLKFYPALPLSLTRRSVPDP